MTTPDNIKRLVDTFGRNIDSYKKTNYNETQVRQEFIDPLFIELGWDLYNSQGFAEAYKDVVLEDKIKVGVATRAPDYSFRIGGTRKFFLEAKKPSVDIYGDIHPAYQLRRYAWSAKLPLSVLTDFEEFSVYDCTIKPIQNDKASTARTYYFKYTDYIDKWEEIYSIFSKEAVMKGSFDKYAASTKKKRGTAEVDDVFLAEMENWREMLAKNLALRNHGLSTRALNETVQKTIDRIVFLRICEDRGIERYGQLQKLVDSKNIYSELKKIFILADEKYNSGIFHFRSEKGREDYDNISLNQLIDDKPLKDILKRLYFPESPYVFSVIPADILGQVYERFLGKVIRLTPGHQAKIEEKPEVRKAGGVYYTPTYIVDYIVKNTVGKLLEGKTPEEAEKLRILDPACGSGSFLLGAFQYLLDWHTEQYSKDTGKYSKGKNPAIHESEGGWMLSTSEKKRILINNIYGVDIDSQAVEVTKLSLLLKVLEGETEETLNSQLKMFSERALPDLGNNIKCGNSLIGPDFYGTENKLFDEEEMYRINVFDWEKEFAEIMKSGGFDAVIGNPPYGALFSVDEKSYLMRNYPLVADYESSQYFILKSTKLLISNGKFGFIIPNTLLLNFFAYKFRKYISENFNIEEILNLTDVDVFDGPTVRTILLFISNNKKISNKIIINKTDGKNKTTISSAINQDNLKTDEDWIKLISDSKNSELFDNIVKNSVPLSDILLISQGLIPYDKYRGHDEYTIKNRIWHSDSKKDNTCKKELRGGDVKRYFVKWNGKQWISYGSWLAAPRKPEFFKMPRLLFREITDTRKGLLHVALTSDEYYNNPGIINCILINNNYSLFYLLGICASKLIAFYHYNTSPKAMKGVFPKILVKDVRRLPIKPIDSSCPGDIVNHDRMANLVEQMLELNKKVHAEGISSQEKKVLQNQIDITDRQIDSLVYELYGLTDEEIKIVEGR